MTEENTMGELNFPLIILLSLSVAWMINHQYFQDLFSFSLSDSETKAAVAGVDVLEKKIVCRFKI